jgi:hypothetical protein
MGLHVRRVNLKDALEFRNRLLRLPAFGHHPAQVITRADEVWVKPDGCVELNERLIRAPLPVEDDAEQIMHDSRTRRSGHRRASRALSLRQIILLQSRDGSIKSRTRRRAQFDATPCRCTLHNTARTARRRSLRQNRKAKRKQKGESKKTEEGCSKV